MTALTLYEISAPSGKRYIGISANVSRRWRQHQSDLRRGAHHNEPLQAASLKYGLDGLVFSILEEGLGPDAAWVVERDLILKDRAEGISYNAKIGDGPVQQHTLETREKIREANRGQTRSPETCAKISEANRNPSLETRARMSEAARNRTPEHAAKIAAAARNRSPERIARIAGLRRGRLHSPESRDKMSRARWGKVASPETRAKQAESARCGHRERRAGLAAEWDWGP